MLKLLLNLVEELKQENHALRAEVQRLRNEINRLKGKQVRIQHAINVSSTQYVMLFGTLVRLQNLPRLF